VLDVLNVVEPAQTHFVADSNSKGWRLIEDNPINFDRRLCRDLKRVAGKKEAD
jgi:hypothetical protein